MLKIDLNLGIFSTNNLKIKGLPWWLSSKESILPMQKLWLSP